MPVTRSPRLKEDDKAAARVKPNPAAQKPKKPKTSYTVRLCVKGGDEAETKWEPQGPMTLEQAKEVIGWAVADEGSALFKDLEGNPIILKNSPSNRPFRMGFAKRYMNEMLDENGHVQSGQHRLVGFILACQEWKRNDAWQSYWTGEPILECLMFTGISSNREVVNTLDIGQKRTLGDVLFREGRFPATMAYKKRQALTNALAGTTRLVWLRSQAKTVSEAGYFPHSEALDFLDEHPLLVESMIHIHAEEGGDAADGRQISRFITVPYAAGLHYLMATCATDSEAFQLSGPSAVDFSMKEKADTFWTLFASGKLPDTNPIGLLKKLLRPTEASSSFGRDLKCHMVVKAFNLWLDGKKATKQSDVMVDLIEDENGRMVLDEPVPRLGGLDVEELEYLREEEQPAPPVEGDYPEEVDSFQEGDLQEGDEGFEEFDGVDEQFDEELSQEEIGEEYEEEPVPPPPAAKRPAAKRK